MEGAVGAETLFKRNRLWNIVAKDQRKQKKMKGGGE
jgi:hypothetical protein